MREHPLKEYKILANMTESADTDKFDEGISFETATTVMKHVIRDKTYAYCDGKPFQFFGDLSTHLLLSKHQWYRSTDTVLYCTVLYCPITGTEVLTLYCLPIHSFIGSVRRDGR